MSDPRADVLRAGYAAVARAYGEHLSDELAGEPLDRGFLDAFAERCQGGRWSGGRCRVRAGARGALPRDARRDVEGIDPSAAMIEEARAGDPEIGFRVGDLFALPYDDAVVRFVRSQVVLLT